jgi:hypothetical protein
LLLIAAMNEEELKARTRAFGMRAIDLTAIMVASRKTIKAREKVRSRTPIENRKSKIENA